MIVRDITSFLDARFPLRLQEKFDHSGGQVCFPDETVSGVLVALDCDANVIDEAIARRANCIITHHPFFFHPVSSIRSGEPRSDMLLRLIDNRISLYSAHTNLDKIFYDKLGLLLRINNRELLIPTDRAAEIDAPAYGFGIYGELDQAVTLDDFLGDLKRNLGLEFLTYSGIGDRSVRRVAIVNGSGGGFVNRIMAERPVDCIVTGDVGYHHARAAADQGIALVDAGHFGTERPLMRFLYEEIDSNRERIGMGSVPLALAEREHNPLRVFL